jgi:hypothetical protein
MREAIFQILECALSCVPLRDGRTSGEVLAVRSVIKGAFAETGQDPAWTRFVRSEYI